MKDKGKFFGILLPVLFVLIVAIIVLISSGVLHEDHINAGEVIAVELEDIEHIRVSEDISYLDGHEDALWTDVWDEEKIAAIHEAIGAVEVEQGDGFDDTLAGGSSRYVEYILYDGSIVELRFADDMQFWLEGTCWHFKEWFVLYETLDEILAGHQYTKAPGA